MPKYRKDELLKDGSNTSFGNNVFLPKYRDLLKREEWKSVNNLLKNRWFYTNFDGVRIDDADTVSAPDLRRYVHDQQFLKNLRENYPKLYNFWNRTTNCGWSALRVAFWSMLAIILFAILYAAPHEIPNWVPTWIADFLPKMPESQRLVDPQAFSSNYPLLPDWAKWFFVSFDIFTNLGIRNTNPQTVWGVFAVFLETIAGFTSLGLLISVLTNKYARRS